MFSSNVAGSCIATVGSVTQTMKAQGLLNSAAIYSRVVKADPASERRGCAYALAFPCSEERRLRAVLRAGGVRIKNIQPAKE